MSTTNEIWLPVAGQLERLDLDDETQLLPSFQANDRTKPDSIQADYSPEFSVPGTQRNHRLLKHAATSQPAQGSAYVRVPAVLTSGGVETLPLALLYLKGYKEGRYLLQLSGGNRRLIEALGDKTLADLDLNRFNHSWLPTTVLTGLTYYWWQSRGWGYEVYDRGKPVDLANLNPYDLYPSIAASLVWNQILTDAGFTADELMGEELFAQLNIATASAFVFPQKFREARALYAGPIVPNSALPQLERSAEFVPNQLTFAFTALAPYHAPSSGATYAAPIYTADTMGYYDLSASMLINYGCDDRSSGEVSCKVMLYVNGVAVLDGAGNQIGQDEHPRVSGYVEETFAPKLSRFLLQPNDTVSLWWQGDEWDTTFGGPSDQKWRLANGNLADVGLGPSLRLYTQATFTVELLEEFPQGGTIKLQDWLPEMKQLDFVKSIMLLLGLTIQVDEYRAHLHLAPGYKLLENIPKARDWTAKRDAYAQPGRLPERDLLFRFGSYGQKNSLNWEEDDHVTPGYGDGSIAVADQVLATTNEMAKLPFAASERSPVVEGLLRILNYTVADITATPRTYNTVEAKPRLTLRPATPTFDVQVIITPAYVDGGGVSHPAVKQPVTTTASYFAAAGVSLLLNGTVLTTYWADLRAMLDQARYLVEYYRLTPRDIAELDFSVPIWDAGLGDYFAVSAVGEYDARRPVEVKLCRLNAAHLPPPFVPNMSDGIEFSTEFTTVEFY